MSIRTVSLMGLSLLLLSACKGDPIATDTGDDDGGGADTSDTAPDIPPEWGPADLTFGPYNMRLIAVNQNTCTAEYTANATFEVEIIPAQGNVLLWDFVDLQSREDQMRANGLGESTVDPTGDGTPDCTVTTRVIGNGSRTSETEFDLNLTVERSGVGDYCGAEYTGYTLPCTDDFSALFTSALAGGGGGGAGGGAGGGGGAGDGGG